MECRRILVFSLPILGTCLLTGLGCVPQQQSAMPVAAPHGVDKDGENDLPKKMPKASTCVAFGDFRSQAANDATRSSQEREQMRNDARLAYQQALKIDPKCLEAYAGLARLYRDLEDYPRAVATYQQALVVQPQDGVLWFELGMCQARHKDWPAAIDSLGKARDLDPENRRAVTTLGFCLARAGRYDDSVACFTKIMPEAQAHYNVARMVHHNQEDAICRQHLQRALQLDPNLAAAHQLLEELDGHGTVPGTPAAGFEEPEGNGPEAATMDTPPRTSQPAYPPMPASPPPSTPAASQRPDIPVDEFWKSSFAEPG